MKYCVCPTFLQDPWLENLQTLIQVYTEVQVFN